VDWKLPELGEGVYEAELVAWQVRPGQMVARGQTLMEVLTDKATMEVPSSFSGTVTALRAEPGQKVQIGQPVLAYDPAGESPPEPAKVAAVAAASPAAAVKRSGNGPASTRTGRVPPKAAPSVRYLARKLGIELDRVSGSGPGGRILVGDLSAFVEAPAGERKPREAAPRPNYGQPGTRIKLVGLRRKIADHMVLAKRTIPHYAYIDECDVTDLVRLRESLKETFARSGAKLTYLAFMVKAVVGALKDVPLVNASLDETANEIVLHDRYHIGIAVATPAGLIVPVLRDADKMDLPQIAREIERLSTEARSSKAKLDDLRGGTFTVTSIGNVGGLISTPVINHPEVGILGVGKIVRRPVYDEAGNVKPADLVYLSFSFDHRVLDGVVGAAFGNAVIARLRNPAALLLPEKLR
jgi:pyruvate/2-oxoglutarate dehydrogenase complex dihydrolipoamide acyltransferase (E2) component